MKKIATAVALAALATSAHAGSWFQFEAGLGATYYHMEDGRWYQQGIPGGSDVTRIAPTITVGLTGSLVTRGAWGIDWHAQYVNLGRAASQCMCTPMDENYDARTHTYSRRYNVPLASFSGSGRSQGAALTIEPYFWLHGVRVGVEAGAYVHRDTWGEYVSGWQVVGSGAPRSFSLSGAYWAVAPVAGVTVGDGRFTLGYRHYFMRANSNAHAGIGQVPPLWSDADVLTVTYKW